jgi:hypothetical protein
MASVSMIKGTKAQIAATPRIDGQILIETDQGDLNKIYTDTDISGTVERTLAGGGGHLIEPNPTGSPAPNENSVTKKINETTNDTEVISSLYGIQQWTNEKTKRFIVEGAASGGRIESNGIGTWIGEDDEVVEVTPVGTENPSSEGWYDIDTTNHVYQLSTDTSVVANKKYFSQVIDESDWLYLDILTMVDKTDTNSGMTSDNIGVGLKFDPATNEPIVLGGYIIDTDTGNICIKFGNTITDTEHARVAIDITYTRNECSIIS